MCFFVGNLLLGFVQYHSLCLLVGRLDHLYLMWLLTWLCLSLLSCYLFSICAIFSLFPSSSYSEFFGSISMVSFNLPCCLINNNSLFCYFGGCFRYILNLIEVSLMLLRPTNHAPSSGPLLSLLEMVSSLSVWLTPHFICSLLSYHFIRDYLPDLLI